MIITGEMCDNDDIYSVRTGVRRDLILFFLMAYQDQSKTFLTDVLLDELVLYLTFRHTIMHAVKMNLQEGDFLIYTYGSDELATSYDEDRVDCGVLTTNSLPSTQQMILYKHTRYVILKTHQLSPITIKIQIVIQKQICNRLGQIANVLKVNKH